MYHREAQKQNKVQSTTTPRYSIIKRCYTRTYHAWEMQVKSCRGQSGTMRFHPISHPAFCCCRYCCCCCCCHCCCKPQGSPKTKQSTIYHHPKIFNNQAMPHSDISCLGNAGEVLPRSKRNDEVPSHLPSSLLLLLVLLLLLLLSLLLQTTGKHKNKTKYNLPPPQDIQ